MKSATVSIPDELRTKLEQYLSSHGNQSELSAVVETAILEYLARREELEAGEFRPFRITPAEVGSGHSDVSINHDAYVADDAYDDAFSQS